MSKDMYAFWEKYVKNRPGEFIAFETLEENAAYHHRTETRHIFRVVNVTSESTVLDLGCGTGRWAFEFAKRCKHVVAVDYSPGMIERAKEDAANLGVKNILFDVATVQDFRSSELFDVIIVSGVLAYFEDDDMLPILENIRRHLKPNGRVISRETVAIRERHKLDDEFHGKVGDVYSAIYRLPEEYPPALAKVGLKLVYSDDFTPTNFPMIFYRRLVPKKHRQNRIARKLLKAALAVQYALDPFLLRHKWTYRPLMHGIWTVKSMLFVYGID
ncbi:class I SAM-dependent methyltransferase [bacterium]|nr:class I SAM-dependent methyltransferase [bacterium]MBU1936705.1 class I SAM-dependent methyltransferase [bacterium]